MMICVEVTEAPNTLNVLAVNSVGNGRGFGPIKGNARGKFSRNIDTPTAVINAIILGLFRRGRYAMASTPRQEPADGLGTDFRIEVVLLLLAALAEIIILGQQPQVFVLLPCQLLLELCDGIRGDNGIFHIGQQGGERLVGVLIVKGAVIVKEYACLRVNERKS